MARLIYSERALQDLERLASFLEDASPAAGGVAVDVILHALDVLGAHPLIGRRVSSSYRELVISRGDTGYLALYTFEAAQGLVRILRIRHQREAGYMD
jgi:plasmid stabilization system protein ParE